MKIVLMIHHFPPQYIGGAELYTLRIARELQRHGHTVEIVCIESISEGELKPTCKTDTYQGLLVHRLSFDIRQAPNQFEWSFRNPELGQWFARYLRRASPDLVHVHGGYLLGGTVLEAAAEIGIPTVLTMHDYWFMCPRITLLRTDNSICERPAPPERCMWCLFSQKHRYTLPDSKLGKYLGDTFVHLYNARSIPSTAGIQSHIDLIVERRRYLKQIAESIDTVISPSRFLIHKVREYGFAPHRLVYLAPGMEPTHLSNPGPRTNRTGLRIGYLGLFAPHKGVHLLLSAFKRLHQAPGTCELVLYGHISRDSPYERKLQKIAARDPAITFAGPYPNQKVGQVLNDLDIVIVPSCWHEIGPTVLLEARATGTLPIATRLGEMARIIKDEKDGLLFERGNEKHLARQIQRLIDNPTLLARLRQNIPPMNTIEQQVKELLQIYRG